MTNIEWCEETWNPVVGCSIVSPGCTNCYAMKQAARIEVMHHGQHMRAGGGAPFSPSHYAGLTQDGKAGPVWTGKVAMVDDHALTKPLRWKRGREIFVNSMGDLFHESVPDAWIDRVFAVMALAPRHTFIVLTKRAKRMREYLSAHGVRDRVILAAATIRAQFGEAQRRLLPADEDIARAWPRPNVFLGVSAERQQEADERIPDLLATPATGRLVSIEPMLGPIDLHHLQPRDPPTEIDALNGTHGVLRPHGGRNARLNGVIVGGESQRGARPMHPDWPRALRDQCAAASVPFFFKQWGEFVVPYDGERACRVCGCTERWACEPNSCFWIEADLCSACKGKATPVERAVKYARFGKRFNGRLLDNVEHNDLPWRPA